LADIVNQVMIARDVPLPADHMPATCLRWRAPALAPQCGVDVQHGGPPPLVAVKDGRTRELSVETIAGLSRDRVYKTAAYAGRSARERCGLLHGE
jgi:hypothetical protein